MWMQQYQYQLHWTTTTVIGETIVIGGDYDKKRKSAERHVNAAVTFRIGQSEEVVKF